VEIRIDKSIQVRMREGVALATDAHRPADDGRYPPLLQRIPYNKEPSWLRDSSGDVLKVSSSRFLRRDRNTSTGSEIAADSEADVEVAVNRVHHNRDYPSRLVLPLIERG